MYNHIASRLTRIATRGTAARRLSPWGLRTTSSPAYGQSWSSSLVPQPGGEPSTSLPSRLIDFSVSAKIEGEESQVAIVTLRPGETLRAESGAMLFMTQDVQMNTDLQGASAAFSRLMTGQNMFLTDFTYTGEKGEGTLGLGTDFPSKIVRLTLNDYEGSALICQRGAYLASNPSVDISMEATKSLSAGFFGGQGFILQRLSGQGDVLVKAGGTLVEKELQAGEQLRVTSGSIVAFTTTVDYDIQMMPGIKNAMFGGEGLFVTTLTGPGKVWLQGMPADRMIAEIARRVPSGGPGIGIPIGMGGGGSSSDGGATATGAAEGAAAGGMAADPAGGVAVTDASVEADRQATVASSGMSMDSENSNIDANSPTELFGDVAPKGEDPFKGADSSTPSSPSETGFQETTFMDDSSSTMDETTFSDDTSFSSSEFEQPSDDSWASGDQATTDVFSSASSEVPEDAGSSISSILSTIWDFFNDDR
jgi:uncharacterized protein (TIGR00266 family)